MVHRGASPDFSISPGAGGGRAPVHVPTPRTPQRLSRRRLVLERTPHPTPPIDAAVCVQCGARHGGGGQPFKMTQLPSGLLGFLPLSVALPLLFPVLIAFLVATRRSATVTLPICAACRQRHRRGQRARRVTTISAAGFALTAPAMVVLTMNAHVLVACIWAAIMTMLMAGLLVVRRVSEPHVLLCERIEDDAVQLLIPGATAERIAPVMGPGVRLERAGKSTPMQLSTR